MGIPRNLYNEDEASLKLAETLYRRAPVTSADLAETIRKDVAIAREVIHEFIGDGTIGKRAEEALLRVIRITNKMRGQP